MNNANNKPKPIKPSISSPLKNKRLLSTFYMIGRTKNFVNEIIFYYTFIKICQINRILNKKPRDFRPRFASLLRTTRKALFWVIFACYPTQHHPNTNENQCPLHNHPYWLKLQYATRPIQGIHRISPLTNKIYRATLKQKM